MNLILFKSGISAPRIGGDWQCWENRSIAVADQMGACLPMLDTAADYYQGLEVEGTPKSGDLWELQPVSANVQDF